MTEVEASRFHQLLSSHLDRESRIIPGAEAIGYVEREDSARSDAERHRLAQARTLLESFELATKRDVDRP